MTITGLYDRTQFIVQAVEHYGERRTYPVVIDFAHVVSIEFRTYQMTPCAIIVTSATNSTADGPYPQTYRVEGEDLHDLENIFREQDQHERERRKIVREEVAKLYPKEQNP